MLASPHLPYMPAQLALQAFLEGFQSLQLLPTLLLLICIPEPKSSITSSRKPSWAMPQHAGMGSFLPSLSPLCDHNHPAVVPSWFYLAFSP